MLLDRKLLELLICPVTRGSLEYDHEHHVLLSRSAKLVYPIREGIPVLLETQAMDLQEWTDQGKPELQPIISAEEAAATASMQGQQPADETKDSDSTHSPDKSNPPD